MPRSLRLSTFIVPVVLGLASGLAGAFIVPAYLFSVSSGVEPALIQIGRPSAQLAPPMAEADLSDRLRKIDLPLYLKKPLTGVDPADRARAPYEAVGYATALTSDGWVVTHQSVLSGGQIVIEVEGRLLEPARQVVDARTGLAFFKIDASALAVAGFADTEMLPASAPLYAQGSERGFAALRFAGRALSPRKPLPGALQDADRFSLSYRFDRAVDAGAVGGAVIAGDGELVGVAAPDAAGGMAFVPMHLIRPVLAAVFRGDPPARALLGARYLAPEEAAFSGSDSALSGVRLSGSRAAGLPAVRNGSAAARAGLRDGDVIVKIDGAELATGRDLAELIAQYAPGAKARFDILRGGERRSLDVTFD